LLRELLPLNKKAAAEICSGIFYEVVYSQTFAI
jgi:hypothetical protein